MIRFIIHTVVSARDSSGNCYNFSNVTSTKTGHALQILSGWGSDGENARSLVRKLMDLDFSEVYYSEAVVPIRTYKSRRPDKYGICEHDLVVKDLKDLERLYRLPRKLTVGDVLTNIDEPLEVGALCPQCGLSYLGDVGKGPSCRRCGYKVAVK